MKTVVSAAAETDRSPLHQRNITPCVLSARSGHKVFLFRTC